MAKILVVDDSKLILTVMEKILSPYYEVFLCESGVKSIGLARDIEPDLIILDIEMKDMGGLEVIVELKRNEYTTNIPVIFLTGLADSETEEAGFLLGAADYIVKPVLENIVRVRVKNQIDLYKYRKQLEYQLNIDPLTNINNKRAFEDAFKKGYKLATKLGGSISLGLLDIDFFKRVNDTYGHLIGDRTLTAVAQILYRIVKKHGGRSFRIGGEELAFMFTDISKEEVIKIAEEIRIAIYEEKIENMESDVCPYLTVSIGGITTESGFKLLKSEVFIAADENLYKAKQNGRNNVQWT
ncbi:MAG: GGDEF domain-containing response regulator [Lachnospiraceae bacterium]